MKSGKKLVVQVACRSEISQKFYSLEIVDEQEPPTQQQLSMEQLQFLSVGVDAICRNKHLQWVAQSTWGRLPLYQGRTRLKEGICKTTVYHPGQCKLPSRGFKDPSSTSGGGGGQTQSAGGPFCASNSFQCFAPKIEPPPSTGEYPLSPPPSSCLQIPSQIQINSNLPQVKKVKNERVSHLASDPKHGTKQASNQREASANGDLGRRGGEGKAHQSKQPPASKLLYKPNQHSLPGKIHQNGGAMPSFGQKLARCSFSCLG